MPADDWTPASLLAAVERARTGVEVTCSASRHVEMIAHDWLKLGRDAADEDCVHVATSLLATVLALYEVRTEVARLRDEVATLQRQLEASWHEQQHGGER
jgi:hypothetical protein